MKKTIAAIVMGTVLAVGSTNAAIVFGNLGNNGTDALQNSGNVTTAGSWFATGFTVAAPNVYLHSATIGLAGSGTIQLSLYSNVGGNPGLSLALDSQSVSSLTASTALYNFGSYPLASGSSYFLVASAVSGSATWTFTDAENDSAGLNGSGWTATAGRRSSDGGFNWSNSGFAAQSSLSIDASPIPEPGTWAAMALFAAGAGYSGWRRRQRVSVA